MLRRWTRGMHRPLGWMLWAACGLCCRMAVAVPPPPEPMPGLRVLDILAHDSAEAAAEAWRASSAIDDEGARIAKQSTAPVEPLVVDGRPVLRMRCNFEGTSIPRAVWDYEIELDLQRATAVVFDIYAENLAAISHAHLYIRSGDGWYGAQWYPREEGAWCRVRIPKSSFYVDKPAAGWSKVSALRMSPWVMKREDAVLYLANFGIEETADASLIVVQEYEDDRREQRASSKYAATVGALLEEAGLPLPTVSTLELAPDVLAGTRLVLLPYAGKMAAETAEVLAGFVRSGGKLIACFSLPGALADLLGVSQQGFRSQAFPGEFSSMRFEDTPPEGAPLSVAQGSWGIIDADAIEGTGRVAAWWHDESGARTEAPAIIMSESGAWFSHIILSDDGVAKGKLLLNLAAHFVPELRGRACTRRLALLGQSVSDSGWQEAVGAVRALPEFAGTRAPAALEEAERHRASAMTAFDAGGWQEATAEADQAEELLRTAYSLAQRPVIPEFRGTWCHPPEGIRGWGWERTAAHLAESGINHLILNALHGASAAYPSDVVPMEAANTDRRDYLTECVEACGRHGIKVHVWITNYRPGGHAPPEFMDDLRAQGRLQVDRAGAITENLCPANDLNVELQREAMVEAALWPGVAGIHFDYIRYPDANTCFCAVCRGKFEERLGRALANWPEDVLADGPVRDEWLQFRRDNITRLVREVHDEVREVAPDCLISAAVFRSYPACRDSVGQDWKLWIDNGWLDFVCPMNYTASDAQFRNLTESQLEIVGGTVPCYPGIGLLTGLGPVGAIRQIQISRDLNTGGFVVWSVYSQYINDVYPYLGLGMLAR